MSEVEHWCDPARQPTFPVNRAILPAYSDRATQRSRSINIGPQELALHVAEIVDGRQGADIVILDVTGPLVIADFFVIATVRNDRHGNALARELIQTLKAEGQTRRNAAGLDSESGWVLLDFDDVVVHLFIEESREFYDLENLWSDAPRVEFVPTAPRAERADDVVQAFAGDSFRSVTDRSTSPATD